MYNNYKIILFGNIVWKNLSISYDKRFINDFLFFSRNLIRNKLDYNNYIYFKSILSILRAEYIIYPVFSREAFFDEFIFDLYSKYKISFYGNDVNHNKDLKFKYDKYYTTLINTNSMFEFYKYQDFFYYFLQSSNISKSTSIIKNLRKKEYIVISIGANSIKRTWNFSNFDKVIQFLLQHKFQIILLGSNNDLNLFSNYNSEIFNNKNLINLIGKTTLKEFVDIISQAKLLISNESSPVHVAVAVNTSFICISNANHYLRFCPYPSELCNFGRYLFPKNFNNTLSRHELYRKFEYGSELDINSINSDDVIEEIIKILD
ncbi:MAG: glycosyltransferase family 9 protein [Bacteroidales bacterium]|nr:glycosyltransferase family 9 protein [Bacteroidales bacterium]